MRRTPEKYSELWDPRITDNLTRAAPISISSRKGFKVSSKCRCSQKSDSGRSKSRRKLERSGLILVNVPGEQILELKPDFEVSMNQIQKKIHRILRLERLQSSSKQRPFSNSDNPAFELRGYSEGSTNREQNQSRGRYSKQIPREDESDNSVFLEGHCQLRFKGNLRLMFSQNGPKNAFPIESDSKDSQVRPKSRGAIPFRIADGKPYLLDNGRAKTAKEIRKINQNIYPLAASQRIIESSSKFDRHERFIINEKKRNKIRNVVASKSYQNKDKINIIKQVKLMNSSSDTISAVAAYPRTNQELQNDNIDSSETLKRGIKPARSSLNIPKYFIPELVIDLNKPTVLEDNIISEEISPLIRFPLSEDIELLKANKLKEEDTDFTLKTIRFKPNKPFLNKIDLLETTASPILLPDMMEITKSIEPTLINTSYESYQYTIQKSKHFAQKKDNKLNSETRKTSIVVPILQITKPDSKRISIRDNEFVISEPITERENIISLGPPPVSPHNISKEGQREVSVEVGSFTLNDLVTKGLYKRKSNASKQLFDKTAVTPKKRISNDLAKIEVRRIEEQRNSKRLSKSIINENIDQTSDAATSKIFPLNLIHCSISISIISRLESHHFQLLVGGSFLRRNAHEIS